MTLKFIRGSQRLPEAENEVEQQRLRGIIGNIRNGSFAKEWMLEQQSGFPMFNRVRQENLAHPMVQAERKVYRIWGRIAD